MCVCVGDEKLENVATMIQLDGFHSMIYGANHVNRIHTICDKKSKSIQNKFDAHDTLNVECIRFFVHCQFASFFFYLLRKLRV